MKRLSHAAAVSVVLGSLAVLCYGAEAPARDALGRGEKLRILVDKVMQPTENWHTKEWIVRETAEAGFNVFSPRCGHDDLDEVRDVTRWCAKYGIYHMPWMRGTLACPDTEQSLGKRMLWAGGNEQLIWSPNSDEFWDWTARYIVQYAQISATMPNLMGVFLDYENYFPNGSGNCYELSYDDQILGLFAGDKGIELPELEPARRKPWLTEQGLHEAFAEFQINHWRAKCRELRQAVDAHDPQFQFCIYPAPGTFFMVQACYPEWATQAAPLILADPWTYGRPSKFMPEAEALESNKRKLLMGMEVPRAAGIPFIYAGGTDPVVAGADPEFCGKNTVMISQVTDGHWIFYEGPTYTQQDHTDYWHWYTWANRKIIAGELEAWHEPRRTPEGWAQEIARHAGDASRLVLPQGTGERVEYPPVRLRRENILVLAPIANRPLEIMLRNHRVGCYDDPLVWRLYDTSMKELAKGSIPPDLAGEVRYTPGVSAVHLLGVSAGGGSYSVVAANVPVGLYAGDGLGLIFGAERLYFHVPPGVTKFSLGAKGQQVENVKLQVFDPSDKLVAEGQTTQKQNAITLSVPAGDGAGKVWGLCVSKPDEGVLEDSTLSVGKGLAPIFSLRPDEVFRAGQE